MGQSYENLLEVQIMLAKYVDVNEPFVTVSELHQYMDHYELSERTVRRCLKALDDKELVESKEVGNTTAYVVYDEDLLPEAQKIY